MIGVLMLLSHAKPVQHGPAPSVWLMLGVALLVLIVVDRLSRVLLPRPPHV